jgi:PAS domain S-box-containing protein
VSGQQDEEALLRSAALQNVRAIHAARLRTEDELIQTREALRESEARMRAIFNNAGVGIALASIDGLFVDMNHRFTEFLHYSFDELRTMTFADITYPDDLAATRNAVAALLSGAVQEYSMEKRYVPRGGMPIWSQTTVSLVRDGAGEPVYFVGVIEDISSRKAAEAALIEETRMLELLNETGRSLAAELDLQAVIQAVTDAGTVLTGAQFGAFFYNTTDESGDALMLYTLSGAPRAAFEGFGNPRAAGLFGPTFRGEGLIRSDDVLRDPRYGTMPPHHGMPPGHLPVRSYLAVSVRSRSGEVIGGLFFGHSECAVFSERSERLIVGVAAQAGIATKSYTD